MEQSTTTKAEVWDLIKETQKRIRETREGIRETRESIKELRESQKQTDEQIKQTNEQMKRTDMRIDKVIGDSGNRWGKLGENLVKGSLAQRLNEKGIKVERVITNAKSGFSEFDIIAINGKEIVVVEVKATLDPLDVEKFKKDMEQFTRLWPEFKERTIYGAIAFLIKANRKANDLAQKEGFFVIEATGDVIIKNKENFKPKVFS